MTATVISLEYFKWDMERCKLSIGSSHFNDRFPSLLHVKSHITGKVAVFVPVQPGDKFFDEDQWDGEQCVYKELGNISSVEQLVVFNGE
jgi:hypothetical protein